VFTFRLAQFNINHFSFSQNYLLSRNSIYLVISHHKILINLPFPFALVICIVVPTKIKLADRIFRNGHSLLPTKVASCERVYRYMNQTDYKT